MANEVEAMIDINEPYEYNESISEINYYEYTQNIHHKHNQITILLVIKLKLIYMRMIFIRYLQEVIYQ